MEETDSLPHALPYLLPLILPMAETLLLLPLRYPNPLFLVCLSAIIFFWDFFFSVYHVLVSYMSCKYEGPIRFFWFRIGFFV